MKNQIKRWLNQHDIWNFSPIGGAYSTKGIPDIICCYRGDLIAIEVKAPGKLGNVTQLQQMQLEKISASGGYAFVADSLQTVVDRFKTIYGEYRF